MLPHSRIAAHSLCSSSSLARGLAREQDARIPSMLVDLRMLLHVCFFKRSCTGSTLCTDLNVISYVLQLTKEAQDNLSSLKAAHLYGSSSERMLCLSKNIQPSNEYEVFTKYCLPIESARPGGGRLENSGTPARGSSGRASLNLVLLHGRHRRCSAAGPAIHARRDAHAVLISCCWRWCTA